MKNLKAQILWILYVAKRISHVDRKGRTAATSMLSSLGICFGVMALIVVMSVMNGFQMSFIDAILDISSYHIQADSIQDIPSFYDYCNDSSFIKSAVPFKEAQGLLVSNDGYQAAGLIRAVPAQVMLMDEGFSSKLKIISGQFDLEDEDSIIVGNSLAYNLRLRVGSKINIAALSGSSDSSLISQGRIFTVKGIFYSSYKDINDTYCFINLESGNKNFGLKTPLMWGIKVRDFKHTEKIEALLKTNFSEANFTSWKNFNRSFFGTLRLEKNMMLFLVLLIFVVVAVNIFNGMKRLVFERKEEIAVLTSIGANPLGIKLIFLTQGFLTGIKGAVPGLVLGLAASFNMKTIFIAISKIQYGIQFLFLKIFSPQLLYALEENPMFRIYASIPPRVFYGEVVMIFLFGVFSAFFAALFASSGILNLKPAEVLRYE